MSEKAELVASLSRIEDQTSKSFFVGKRALSIAELIVEIESETELGLEMLRLHKSSLATLARIKKERSVKYRIKKLFSRIANFLGA